MNGAATIQESPAANERAKVLVIKPIHIGIAMVLHLVVIIFTIGLFYGTMRTQIDDDRAMIQLLIKSNEDLQKSVSDMNVQMGQIKGNLDTMIRMNSRP